MFDDRRWGDDPRDLDDDSRDRDRDQEWREPGHTRDPGDDHGHRSVEHAYDPRDPDQRDRDRDDDGGPHLGRGPSSRDEKSESDPRDRDDERWPERDRDPRNPDHRDVFMRDLSLPRGRERSTP